MATQGQVKKIYRLETIGYDSIHKQFTQLSEDLIKIKKLIVDLQGKKIGLTGDDLHKVNQEIVAASRAEEVLKKNVDDLNGSNQTSIKTYFELNKAYQAAKKNAQDLAAAHGVESLEAKEAAATAAAYKQQLVEINNLVKTGGRPLAPVVPINQAPSSQPASVTNIGVDDSDITKTGDVLTELEKKEAAAANEAFALGQAQQDLTEEIRETGVEVSQITTKYEQYTGTIRQNLTAQIENQQQLIKNRAAQKDIQTAINAQGFATDAQIQKMAALREEEQILIETNKALTLTIRNQTKEFISAEGSIDRMQAQLNQLQQTYEQLTETEKASPFGQAMKAEIDVLEPKVKSLEAELGKFQRNVGNYPQQFGGAFKVLEKELDTIKGKVVAGNFGTKELANLTAQEKVLENATKVLNQQFTSTTQQMAAFKEQARILALTFGTDSAVFKQFTAQMAITNTEIKKADQQIAATGKTATGVFGKMYGGLRQLANVIPGFGIGTLVLLLLTPLETLASSIIKVGKSAKTAGQDIITFAEKQKVLKEINEEAIKSFAEEITRIEILGKIINDKTLPLENRNKAVAEYNKLADEGNKIDKVAINNTALIEQAINRQIELIQKRALARAAENIIAKKAEELLLKQFRLESEFPAENEARIQELTDKAQKILNEASKKLKLKAPKAQDFLAFFDLPEDVIKKAPGDIAKLRSLLDERSKVLLTSFDSQLKLIQRNRQNLGGGTAGLKVLVDDISNLNTELKHVTEIGLGFIKDVGGEFEKPAKTKDEDLQNKLRLIEANRLQQVAIENKRVNDIQKIRDLTFSEEIFHLRELERINVDALTKKTALYNQKEKALLAIKKKLSAEELKDRAEFAEQITSIELDTSKKINDIEQKRFEKNIKNLQDKLNREINQINVGKNAIIDNINSTELEKAQAQLNADEKELEARKKFFVAVLFLNQQFNLQAIQQAKDAIAKQQQETEKDRQKIIGATLAEVKANGDKEVQAQDIKFGILRNKILANDRITNDKRKKQLDELGKAHERTVLAIELKTLQAQFELAKTMFALGLITEKAFLDIQAKFVEKANQLQQSIDNSTKKLRDKFSNLKDIIQKGVRDLFKVDSGTAEDQAIGEIIAQSYDLALSAMNDFFDAERQRIEQSLKLNLERLDMEEEQVKARATSQAEIAAIEKEFAAKKRNEERKAHEDLKKAKRSEAKIAFAIELANIWASAMSYPFPANIIIGGVLSGLAGARLALNLNRINRETFAKGGMPGQRPGVISNVWNGVKTVFGFGGKASEVPTQGGKFGGKPHSEGGTDFDFKGKKYNAEVEELAVIRTRNAPSSKIFTITGTQMQIASAANKIGGGTNFKPGANIHKMETGGYLGTSLEAPIFTTASNNAISSTSSTSNQKMDELIDAIKESNETGKDQVKAINGRIDRLEVVQDTRTVTKSQKQLKQYSDIATL